MCAAWCSPGRHTRAESTCGAILRRPSGGTRPASLGKAIEMERKALAVMDELRAHRNPPLTSRLDRWTPNFQARRKLYEASQPYADPPYDPSSEGRNPNPMSDLFW